MSEIKLLGGLISSEASLLRLLMASFSLCLYMVFPKSPLLTRALDCNHSSNLFLPFASTASKYNHIFTH